MIKEKKYMLAPTKTETKNEWKINKHTHAIKTTEKKAK